MEAVAIQTHEEHKEKIKQVYKEVKTRISIKKKGHALSVAFLFMADKMVNRFDEILHRKFKQDGKKFEDLQDL